MNRVHANSAIKFCFFLYLLTAAEVLALPGKENWLAKIFVCASASSVPTEGYALAKLFCRRKKENTLLLSIHYHSMCFNGQETFR